MMLDWNYQSPTKLYYAAVDGPEIVDVALAAAVAIAEFVARPSAQCLILLELQGKELSGVLQMMERFARNLR